MENSTRRETHDDRDAAGLALLCKNVLIQRVDEMHAPCAVQYSLNQ